ncbi:serine/threonine-protein kinase unc-51-like isoform X2 [Pecten maximus]|uniref:serine/threonine-protein kinase unc-51-like isoform X2 n=1 Tax=Pecten maximus TaxID=6579 RepID=UPI0014583590|nr:serine/threonine-protein kinase unc-51-like isoform X2 [Pecten maximus]
MEIIGEFEYNKKDLIGHGAFAVVFKGRSRKKPPTTVAIKSITKKNLAKSQNLLSKEIKILKELSDLHHDNVVALLDCKETTNHVYLVMEYCNGGDLADFLQAKGTLSENTISQFLRQIAAAMRALHGKGIVHRDLKPQNILLQNPPGKTNPSPCEMILKIADFGFARFLHDGVMAATLCGSPMYMAPEVIMSMQYDAKADLWSIGTIVFQCLTGKAPFQAQTPQQLKHFYEKHAELKPNVPKDTSSGLRDLLLRMLKRNARDRIAFEDFFIHPFLNPPPALKASSPVPVPSRSSHGFSSASPTPPSHVSASPLSGRAEFSPPPRRPPPPPPPTTAPLPTPPPVPSPVKITPPKPLQVIKREEAEAIHGSSQEVAGFLKVEKGGQTPRSNSPTEDFVMVPVSLPCENLQGSAEKPVKAPTPEEISVKAVEPLPLPLAVVKVSPSSGAAAFKKSPEEATSPSRPSTLPMQTDTPPPTKPHSSEPIPVPGQVQAYHRMSAGSPSSPRKNSMDISPTGSSTGSNKDSTEKKDMKTSPATVEAKLCGPDIGSLSPPAVKFSIGTPPSTGQWKRGSIGATPSRFSTTPPSIANSPHRRSGSSSPQFPVVAPASLPAIIGSPPKLGMVDRRSPEGLDSQPVNAPFGSSRPKTVPDDMATMPYKGPAQVTAGNPTVRRNLLDQGRSSTEPTVFNNLEGGSLLSEQLVRAAFGTPPQPFNNQGSVVPFSSAGWRGSKEKVGSLGSPGSDKSLPSDTDKSTTYVRRSTEPSPPPSAIFAQSPSNMEGPVTFVAPGLAEETLMDDNHNETMAKLSFVLDLVDCIIELAQTRGAPLQGFTESVNLKQGEALPSEQLPKFTETQRRLEQLVLYVRSLHLLSSSLQLARKEIKEERLQISTSLRNVLRQMNESYHRCVNMCKQIQHRLGTGIQNTLTPQLAVATADKLIYNYAIEMCQNAALDELFGNPHECFRRYQTAHLLLHSLSQQAHNTRDKQLLNKYKEAVERRLANVHTAPQAYIPPFEAVS